MDDIDEHLSRYPLHEKILAHGEEKDAITAFIEWLRYGDTVVTDNVVGLVTTQHLDDASPSGKVHYYDLSDQWVEKLIAAYFGIDIGEFYAEKDLMLRDIREAMAQQEQEEG